MYLPETETKEKIMKQLPWILLSIVTFLIGFLISFFISHSNGYKSGVSYENLIMQSKIDSITKDYNTSITKSQYYETGWTLVKINGSLEDELSDSVRYLNCGTNGLYRLFNEGAGASLSFKIQDIELCGSMTSFDCGKKLYIISKTPF